jgi:hypothetical protein
MKLKIILVWLIALFIAADSYGQVKVSDGGRKVKDKATGEKTKLKAAEPEPPAWSAAQNYRSDQVVYFPDYYIFYDPDRGYVYWENDTWISSRTLPDFLAAADLGTARIERLTDVKPDVHAEMNYVEYMKRYPAEPVDITVPVPVIR